MGETCTCGDVLDEHEGPAGPCLVCPCVAFEADEDGENDG